MRAATAPGTPAPPAIGSRWMAGIGVDRPFALTSTLVGADVFAERFIGLYNRIDWTAEAGLRQQWTPQLVLDLGVVRRYLGVAPYTAVTVGATYAMPVRPLRFPP